MERWKPESFDEKSVNDLETARLALRWAVGQIHTFQDSLAAVKGELQEKEGRGRVMEERLREAERSLAEWEERERLWKQQAESQLAREVETRGTRQREQEKSLRESLQRMARELEEGKTALDRQASESARSREEREALAVKSRDLEIRLKTAMMARQKWESEAVGLSSRLVELTHQVSVLSQQKAHLEKQWEAERQSRLLDMEAEKTLRAQQVEALKKAEASRWEEEVAGLRREAADASQALERERTGRLEAQRKLDGLHSSGETLRDQNALLKEELEKMSLNWREERAQLVAWWEEQMRMKETAFQDLSTAGKKQEEVWVRERQQLEQERGESIRDREKWREESTRLREQVFELKARAESLLEQKQQTSSLLEAERRTHAAELQEQQVRQAHRLEEFQAQEALLREEQRKSHAAREAELSGKAAFLEKELEEWRTRWTETEKRLYALEAENGRLSASAQKWEDQASALRVRLQETEAQLQQDRALLSGSEEGLRNSLIQLDALQQENGTLRKELEQGRAAAATERAELMGRLDSAHQVHLRALEEQKAGFAREMEEWKAGESEFWAAKEKAWEAQKTDWAARLRVLEEEARRSSQETQSWKAQSESLRQELADARSLGGRLTERQSILEGLLAEERQGRARDLEEQRLRLTAELEGWKAKESSAREEREKAWAAREGDLSARLGQAEQERDSFRSQYRDAEQALQSLREEKVRLNAFTAELDNRIEDLEQVLKKVGDERDKEKTRRLESEAAVRRQALENTAIRQQNEGLKKEMENILAEGETERAELTKRLEQQAQRHDEALRALSAELEKTQAVRAEERRREDQERENIRQESRKWEESAKRLEERFTQAASQLRHAEERLIELEATLVRERQTQEAMLKTRVEEGDRRLREAEAAHAAETEKWEAARAALRQEAETWRMKHQAAAQEWEEESRRAEQQESRAKALEESLARTEADREEERNRRMAIEEALRKARLEVQELSLAGEDLKKEAARAVSEAEKVRTELTDRWSREISSLRDASTQAEQEREEQRRRWAEERALWQSERVRSKEEKEILQKHLAELKSESVLLREEKSSFQRRLEAEQESRLKELDELKVQFTRELQAWRKRENLQKQEADERTRAREAELLHKAEALKALEGERAKWETEAERLRAELSQRMSEAERFREQKAAAERTLQSEREARLSEMERQRGEAARLMEEAGRQSAEAAERERLLIQERSRLEAALSHARIESEAERRRAKERDRKLRELESEAAALRESALRPQDPGASSVEDGRDAGVQDLVFGIAHQLRTPLAVMQSFAESSLESRWAWRKDRDAFRALLRSIDTIKERIEVLTEFSRPVRLARQRTPLAPFLEKTAALIKNKCLEQNVSLELEPADAELEAFIDTDQLCAALLHLLLNAVEATPAGGTVRLTAAREKDAVVLRVTDTGRGMEPDRIEEMMRPFFSTKPGGMGLGLPVAHKVMKAHGGGLEIRSEPGKGTEVLCRLGG